MRILHVDTGSSLRGGQIQLLKLLAGLKARGHSQTLLARGAVLQNWPGQAPTVINLHRAANGADLVHAHDARGHTLAAITCWGLPIVVSRRVAFPVKRGMLSRWKYGRGAHYIAVSEHVRSRLTEAGIPRSLITVIYDGVDPGAPPSRPLSTEARQLSALKIVTPATGDPLKGGELSHEVERRAGISLIRSSDLESDLAQADLFLYLSESEGLGSAILLAMARGVPVVASNTGGIPEIVEHEATGLLVENDPGAVSAALERLAADPVLAANCVQSARRQVEERFSEDRMVRRTELVYRALSGGEKPA